MDRPHATQDAQFFLHRLLELNMGRIVDHTTLHRAAKYFMDSGKAATHDAAMNLLKRFGLTIHAGAEMARSADHQTALLTLVNVARRTLLGGIEVIGLQDVPSLTPLAPGRMLSVAVRELGGQIVAEPRHDWPSAVIGNTHASPAEAPSWRVTWEGWRGGVVPVGHGSALSETGGMALAPALAAAVCAGEAFAYHAGDHPMAGRRAAGLSLWRPGTDWRAADPSEPALAYLPSKLWLIGLGNLGQAFAWLLACLSYEDRAQVQFLLQDFDRLAPSNDSTSLLSFLRDVGRRKTRVVAKWLEQRGFETLLEERRFGPWISRASDEPSVALCGVDNALARAALEKPGFDLVVEAGLGAGPQAFRSFSMHAFPASRSAEEIWSRQIAAAGDNFEDRPAYRALRHEGMDQCGLAQLASRTVGVPFVGLIAAALAISELLRRLHGGTALELASGSAAALQDIEAISIPAQPFPGAYVETAKGCTDETDVGRNS
jgi:hypothetical protein